MDSTSSSVAKMFAHFKPDPQGLLLAAERAGSRPDVVLYVGDSLTDAETGRRAKARFLAVLSGMTRREGFDGYQPDGKNGDSQRAPTMDVAWQDLSLRRLWQSPIFPGQGHGMPCPQISTHDGKEQETSGEKRETEPGALRLGHSSASARGAGIPACRVGILADMPRWPGSGPRPAPPYARKNAGAAA